jgi:flagellar hook-associated protein 3 FlgL
MNRISSAMIPASSLVDIQRAQRELVEAARQSSQQTRATDLQGYGRQAQTLVSAERLSSRLNGFQETARELTSRLKIQDVALDRAAEAVGKLKAGLFQNFTLDSGDGVRVQLEEAFAALKDTMNVDLGGRYLFGGVMNDRPPVAAASLADLAANPLSVSLEQGAQAQAGPVADDVVGQAMAAIKRLAELDGGVNGPFARQLTPVQKDALESEIANLSSAFETILSRQVDNGGLMKDVEAAEDRLTARVTALDSVIGGIVEVDLAEVAVRLNQAQFAYETSASVFNILRDMSLLKMLR